MPDDFDDVFTSVTQEDLNPEIEDEEPPAREEQDLPFGTAPGKTTGPRVKSALDAVLDAVQGKPPVVKDRRSCPKCGSKNTDRRGGLMGGTLVLKCREVGCRAEVPIGSYKPLFLPPVGSTGPAVASGPYDGEVRPAPEPFAPMFKRKS